MQSRQIDFGVNARAVGTSMPQVVTYFLEGQPLREQPPRTCMTQDMRTPVERFQTDLVDARAATQ